METLHNRFVLLPEPLISGRLRSPCPTAALSMAKTHAMTNVTTAGVLSVQVSAPDPLRMEVDALRREIADLTKKFGYVQKRLEDLERTKVEPVSPSGRRSRSYYYLRLAKTPSILTVPFGLLIITFPFRRMTPDGLMCQTSLPHVDQISRPRWGFRLPKSRSRQSPQSPISGITRRRRPLNGRDLRMSTKNRPRSKSRTYR